MDYRDLEGLYDKCGGKFRLAVLLQKRVQQLVKGDRRLVSVESENPIDIALAEVIQGKVWLDGNDQLASAS